MNISIFGLGYVGCVGVGCLAEMGHQVVGVDVEQTKVNLINEGKATIVENGIDELIFSNKKRNRIKATTNVKEAVSESDVAIICVGTPNDANGHLNMEYIENVAREIGRELKEKNGFYTIAIRSTVMPGTNKKIAGIIANKSGKASNMDFGVVSNPEFLREGSAVKDFFNPPYTVLASESEKAIKVMKDVYSGINGDIQIVDVGTAELIKFVNNSFHALKVAFGNEIGRICKELNVNVFSLMDLFVKDTILNISPYYFRPGFAYGGSCLPKDLKALNTIAHDKYINVPILSSIDDSNRVHIDYAYKIIISKGIRNIGFLGISFKPGTDDLRFSPILELVERLLGKGYNVKVFDSNINVSRLLGKNKDYLLSKLRHIDKILVTNEDEFIKQSELFVISHNHKKIISKILDSEKYIFELNKVIDNINDEQGEGISW